MKPAWREPILIGLLSALAVLLITAELPGLAHALGFGALVALKVWLLVKAISVLYPMGGKRGR